MKIIFNDVFWKILHTLTLCAYINVMISTEVNYNAVHCLFYVLIELKNCNFENNEFTFTLYLKGD
jgi:hypothetical protein